MAEQRAAGLQAKRGGDQSTGQELCLTLDDIGVTKKQSADWGKLAALPEAERRACAIRLRAVRKWANC